MLSLVRPTTSLARTGQSQPQAWDAWSEMARVREEMDDLVTRAFGWTPLSRMVGEGAPSNPATELYETPQHLVFRAYLPGLSREDINLEAMAEKLVLWGERRLHAIPEEAKLHFRTVPSGRFRLELALPAEIKTEEIAASYRDGVLEVTLPKAQVSHPKPVKIEIGS